MSRRGISARAPDIDKNFLRGKPEVVQGFGRGTVGIGQPLVIVMVGLLALALIFGQ